MVVLFWFYLLLFVFSTLSCTKYSNWIFRNCKHFLIASSKSPPTTKSPVDDGKIFFLFNYFKAVFEQISLWTPWINWLKFLLKINFARSSQTLRFILYGRFHQMRLIQLWEVPTHLSTNGGVPRRKKCPNTGVFLVLIFPCSEWIRRSTEEVSVSISNTGKYEPK